jgi:putative Ca2+/H+ antiporter (TMEM165/GDT1 family)
VGAVLALWLVGGIAIVGGQRLLGRVPLHRVTQGAATIMAVLAVVSLAQVLS